MSKSALMPVEFHGATLSLVSIEDKPYVAIKPICEALTIAWNAQFERIKRNPVLSKGIRVIRTPSSGGMQEMTCLPLSMLNGWLFGINANRVKNPVIRQKLIEYQFECYDVLNNYWSGKTVHVATAQQPYDANSLTGPDRVITHSDMMVIHTLIERARYLVGFWHQYEPAIRMLNSNIAASVHDCFLDASWSASRLADALGIPVRPREYFLNYPFHKNSFEKHQYYLAHGKKETS